MFLAHRLDHSASLIGALNVYHLMMWAYCEPCTRLEQFLMQHVLVSIVITDSCRLNAERVIAVSLSPVMLTVLSLALVDFDHKLVKLFIFIYRGSRWLLLLQLYLILTATGCRFLEQAQNTRFIPAVNRMLFSFVSLSRCSWKMDHLSDLLLSVFSFLKFIHITMDLRRNQFCPLLLLL